MEKGSTVYSFTYDPAGRPVSVTEGNDTYYYILNQQGDVIGIVDDEGIYIVSYVYDAWGQPVNMLGSDAFGLGVRNPLRYRGYVYDTETGLYYLQSRYYNPIIGRFINADAFIGTGQGVMGCNMYAYCGNNPVIRVDAGGYFWDTLFDIASAVWSIADVIANPSSTEAWVGLAFDLADIGIPFVSGLGESARAMNAVVDVADAMDDVHDVGSVVDIAHAATKGTPNEIGRIGEQLAGINPRAKKAIQINGRTRIPDALTETMLIEVKNVKYISNTRQLRDFADYAGATGRTMVLYIRPKRKLRKQSTMLDGKYVIFGRRRGEYGVVQQSNT